MADSAEIPHPLPPAATPGRRLWQRFRRARGGVVGLVLIILFGLTAFLAPFIAHRLPIYWIDNATGAMTFPLLRDFFSPADTTEPMLEKGINFLFVLIPIGLAAWALMNKFLPALARSESRLVSLLFGALFSGFLWLAIGGMVVQGGGQDWFYAEAPPVPEADDIADPAALSRALARNDADAGSNPALASLSVLLAEHGFNPAAIPPLLPVRQDEVDEIRRAIAPPIQNVIEGEPILPPGDPVGPGFDPLDITPDNFHLGINAARWNRMLVEYAAPGLLNPARTFRTSFVIVAIASLLVLLGLTYIFLAGANQFALSPRWLALLLVAALVAIPFSQSPRHDHTPYRQLAADGLRRGLFPLVPYGPNEQGFGPRLPPSWYQPSAGLAESDILSWSSLIRFLADPDNRSAEPIAAHLDSAVPSWREAGTETPNAGAAQSLVLTELNRLIDTADLYDPAAADSYRRDRNLLPYLRERTAGRDMTRTDIDRMNRLIVEQAAPGAIVPVAAGQWKKPNHTPGTHLAGTDESGRDVLVRIVHGARVSLSVGFVSVFLSTIIGLVLGSLAAYYGGWVDMLISRFMEIMMCFPSFFLILAVIAVLDRRSIVNIMLVIGLTSWTGVARLVRGEMLRQKKMEYVAASIALGAPDTRTIFRHILPNAMAPVLVSISFGITGAILTEASLSFIGFGVTPPTPTWGQLLSETRESPLATWWLAVFPGIVLFVGVLAYNLVGEALRDALDPRSY